MKVVLLCGGQGTRLREETEFKPKPMVEIGGKPILWHIMKFYAAQGFNEFIVCLGYKGGIIKDFFYNYELRASDVTVSLGASKYVEYHDVHPEDGWKVTLVETGNATMTGARVKRAARYLDDKPFLLTYGDGVADVDLKKLIAFHAAHGRTGTVTGVYAPSRYGVLQTRKDTVAKFAEKPRVENSSINGGFFVFEPKLLDYLSDDADCVLEGAPLGKMSDAGELGVYRHSGFWQCMDTYNDFLLLNRLWDSGQAPWRIWKDEANSPKR